MQIDGIHVKNFLSFDSFDWSGLDPHLNIVVGPNGSGKTNLLQVFRAAKDILNPNQGQQKVLWAQNTYRGSDNVSIELSLDVRFTSTWERNLLSTFLAATFCNEQVLRDAFTDLQNGGNEIPSDTTVEQEQFSFVMQNSLHSLENIEWLFIGRLVMIYKRKNWTIWYESRPHNQAFRLNLDGLSFYDSSVQISFLQYLLLQKERFTPTGQLLLVTLLSRATRNMIPWIIELPSFTTLTTHQAFEQLTGEVLKSDRYYRISSLFLLLFERSFVFTDNIRSQTQLEFSFDSLYAQPIDLSSGEHLARYLFLKKNGTGSDREQYRSIQDMFFRVTGRSFEVSFGQPNVPLQLTAESRSDVALSILITTHWKDISLAFSGAGIGEALFICALIAVGKNQILLLDEPASNIHVTMQKALLKEVQTLNGNGNQFVIVTHSPALVPPEAITCVSRFFMRQGHTCCVSLDRNTMDAEKFASLEKELRRSTDARAMLFSRGVILVEGETEQGALPIWFEKRFGTLLESDDIIIYSVNSDTNFGKFVQFLQQFSIPWVIICDGKVIGDCIASRNRPRIIRQLEKAGILNLTDHIGKDFSQFCHLLEVNGVFTLAKDINDEIETLPIIQAHQQEAKDQVGDSKVRQAQYIATTYDCPTEVAALLQKVMRYLINLWEI